MTGRGCLLWSGNVDVSWRHKCPDSAQTGVTNDVVDPGGHLSDGPHDDVHKEHRVTVIHRDTEE